MVGLQVKLVCIYFSTQDIAYKFYSMFVHYSFGLLDCIYKDTCMYYHRTFRVFTFSILKFLHRFGDRGLACYSLLSLWCLSLSYPLLRNTCTCTEVRNPSFNMFQFQSVVCCTSSSLLFSIWRCRRCNTYCGLPSPLPGTLHILSHLIQIFSQLSSYYWP